ncbi:MAG: acyl-CoA dehydrogenase family protein [Clostridia bacterium]|nr:acyl-CoA dehydrogenase family protein [Clostridia bacterium]
MDFELTQEQEAMKRMVKQFTRLEIAPYAAEWDEKGEFSRATFNYMSELGLAGMSIPEEYGGTELDNLTIALVLEEIAQGCAATATYLAVHNMVAGVIHKFGTVEQKLKWLPVMGSGKKLGAFCLTEPNAGSDAAGIQTTARAEGDYYVINGSKIYITSGGEAEVYVVVVKTGGKKKSAAISTFIVEKGTPGFTFGKTERKMGLNASPNRELVFQDCRIPKENILGSPGQGFKIAMTALESGRINIGSIAVGLAQAALDTAVQYAKERRQFGRPIAGFQGIQFMMADMATDIEAARGLVQRAAFLLDRRKYARTMVAMAKKFATDAAMRITTDAVQIMGGCGYIKEYPVERYMRAAKVLQILEGTNQIQRLIIAKDLLGW